MKRFAYPVAIAAIMAGCAAQPVVPERSGPQSVMDELISQEMQARRQRQQVERRESEHRNERPVAPAAPAAPSKPGTDCIVLGDGLGGGTVHCD